jgi:DNA-binding transcriptional ArsR family regulator
MTSSGNMSGAALSAAAPIFAALGDRTRLKIVARLCGEGPLSIVRLTEGGKVSRQAVTKHLRALERAGLAQSSRIGRERHWELKARRLAEARRYLEEISAGWDAAIDRLRAHLELDLDRRRGP